MKTSQTTVPNDATLDGFLPLPNHLPDFFIVGGPKCGTSSLFSWLQAHPDTYLPRKEPNFLSRDVYDARQHPGAFRNWDAYLSYLMPPDAFGKRTGEATPRYLYSDTALDILAHHPTQPKVIVLLRNPIDLVYSLHAQMLRNGVETKTDFACAWERAVARQGDPRAWLAQTGMPDHRLDYPMFGRLGARLRALRARIPDDRLHILVLEEAMTEDPEAAFGSVLAFLGLKQKELSLISRNTRVDLRSAWLHRHLVRMRRGTLARLEQLGLKVERGPEQKGTGLLKLIMRANTTTTKTTLGPSGRQRKDLAAFFASDIALLQAELGRSIPAWADWSGTSEDGESRYD